MESKKIMIGILNKIADLMELKGENPFKIKAFRNGANALRSFDGVLEDLIKKENPVKIKGIGKGILSVIREYIETGIVEDLNQLIEEFPKGIEELLEIKGLGIKKIKFLFEELKIENVEDLEIAIKSGKLDNIKNFGAKTLNKILLEIEKLKSRRKLMLLNQAEEIAEHVISILKNNIQEIRKIEISGELRRVREIINKIEIVVLLEENTSGVFEEKLNKLFSYNELTSDDSLAGYKLLNFGEREIVVYVTENLSKFVTAQFRFTGTEEFVYSFNLNGAFRKESDIFKLNNSPKFIPEVREHKREIISRNNSDLCFGEMKGMLHFHTIWSDGHNSLEEMVRKGLDLGFEYFAVCDHSKSAYYANGLNEERLIQQKEEIENLSKILNVKILQGNEVDILPDGSLDFSDDILNQLDFVIASVHSSFNLSNEKMTERIIKAVENPFVVALGHPTGRLLLRREPYAIDILKVIDACAANNVAIEINANPWRLDLDWRNIDYALNKNAIFTINADAHSTSDISYTKYGVKIARKGGLLKDEVINYWSLQKLTDFINSKRK